MSSSGDFVEEDISIDLGGEEISDDGAEIESFVLTSGRFHECCQISVELSLHEVAESAREGQVKEAAPSREPGLELLDEQNVIAGNLVGVQLDQQLLELTDGV